MDKERGRAGLKLCRKIALVPHEVKYTALKFYIDKCREYNQIAFL